MAYYEVSSRCNWNVLSAAIVSAGGFPRRVGGVRLGLLSPLRPSLDKYFYPLLHFSKALPIPCLMLFKIFIEFSPPFDEYYT